MDYSLIIHLAGISVAVSFDDLSYNTFAAQSHTYPGPYYYASNVVDRNTTSCMRTNSIGTSFAYPYKTVWWKVDLGGVYSIYSINILFKNYDDAYEDRQRGRFAGFSLYLSNTDVTNTDAIKGSTICYKNGHQLPSLNFTAICPQFGRYVIFYNARLNGVSYPTGYELNNVYTELCEVVVYGCKKSGVYGRYCNISCPLSCKDSKCHMQNGTCYACRPGWTGTTCNAKCTEGWYGINCNLRCAGHCRDWAACNHVTGQCDGGCDAGWTGSLCDKGCTETFGFDCTHNCSGNCINNSACNRYTGHCDGGCSPGYTNIQCMEICSSGYYGLDCKNRCSGYCLDNEPCDHVSGVCTNGCKDGYIGTFCNAYCVAGYYGKNCSLICSSNCSKCRHTDGTCITSLEILETTDSEHTSSAWIVGFLILLTVNIIISSALIIIVRRMLNGKDANQICCWMSVFRENQRKSEGDTNDSVSQYQELSVSKGDNTYQTLTLK